MYQQIPLCQECKEPVKTEDMRHIGQRDGHLGYYRVWHFQCLPLELAFSGQVTLDTDQLARWNAWKISQLLKANTALRQRTRALQGEVKRLMDKTGASEEEITDFVVEFSIYDEDMNAPPTA